MARRHPGRRGDRGLYRFVGRRDAGADAVTTARVLCAACFDKFFPGYRFRYIPEATCEECGRYCLGIIPTREDDDDA